MFSKDDIVFSYTTKDAVRDEVLIPIPRIVSESLGINVPVYFNYSVWSSYVTILKEEEYTERMSEILAEFAVRARNCNHHSLKFSVDLAMDSCWIEMRNERPAAEPGVRTVRLKAIINAHDVDDPSPAVFFMLPWED